MATCRECGARISFRLTANGKKQPIDEATGEVHFAVCPARQKEPLPDHVCLKCGSLNVERLPGSWPHYGALKCRDCGARRWLRRPTPEE